MADEDNGAEVLRLAVTIVSAHVSNNPVAAADLPALITTVHEALVNPAGTPKPSTPAVPIKKSVTPNYLICLDRLQEATIEKDGTRITTRTVVAGQVGRVFQAAGVALPPNMREHEA